MSWVTDTFFGGAEKDAARAQVEAGDRAIAANERALETARGDLQPFRQIGESVANPLVDFVLKGPESELERTRGFQDIQRSAAAGGKLNSGGTLEELTSFNHMLNSRDRQQSFNELFNLATLGSNAASGQATATLNTARSNADTLIGQGDSIAAGKIGSANAQRGTIGSFLSLLGAS